MTSQLIIGSVSTTPKKDPFVSIRMEKVSISRAVEWHSKLEQGLILFN